MTGNKLLSCLLRMQGFRATWFELVSAQNVLRIGVKPHKTGCRCPHCGRRGKIVARADCRQWDDVVICGMRVIFFMLHAKYDALRTDGSRSEYLGQKAMRALPTVWNILCWYSVKS